MGMADDMKKLGEDIVASYDMRVKAIGALVSDVRKTRDDTRKRMEELASDRMKMSKKQAKALRDFVRDLINNVDTMMEDFRKNHKAMADEIKKMASNWQSTAAAMAKKRGIKPRGKGGGKGKA